MDRNPRFKPGPAQAAIADEAAQLAMLLQMSSRGDEAAFAQVYDLTSNRIYGLILRVIRDPAQAEEVSQEAYLEIWRTSGRFDRERGGALPWMLTIAHRRAVDRVRSAEAANTREVRYESENQTPDHDTTAEQVESSLEAQRVRRALASLTAIQRQAVELAFLSGYTHTEVAGMLDLPVGTAKTRIRDGLIRMRDMMGVGQ